MLFLHANEIFEVLVVRNKRDSAEGNWWKFRRVGLNRLCECTVCLLTNRMGLFYNVNHDSYDQYGRTFFLHGNMGYLQWGMSE